MCIWVGEGVRPGERRNAEICKEPRHVVELRILVPATWRCCQLPCSRPTGRVW